MGMFKNLMSKIFGNRADAPSSMPAPTVRPTPAQQAGVPEPGAPAPAPQAAPAAPAPVAVAEVDVTAILDGLAASNPQKLDWKRSIVDLLKLVGMDSSLSARKELADELHYTGDKSDSATMNIWLHKQVIRKIAENGGKVPADLLD